VDKKLSELRSDVLFTVKLRDGREVLLYLVLKKTKVKLFYWVEEDAGARTSPPRRFLRRCIGV
jgi:hypothetical protein